MGNTLCHPEQSTNKIAKQTTAQVTKVTEELSYLDQNIQGNFGEEGCNPLQEFIANHSMKEPICASNNLNILMQAQKQESAKKQPPAEKVAKPLAKSAIKKVQKQNKNATKRCSIDPGNKFQFKQSNFSPSKSDKNVEEYGRIQISQQHFIHLRKQDIRKYYKFQEIIGEGSFGSVYKALELRTKQIRAIKIIKKQALGGNKKNQVFAELELLKKMDHPNIIKLYQVYQTSNRYQVVTQFCNGGSIIDFIKTRKTFSQKIIKVILKQLLGCLNYLHTLNIVHRDIKLQNVIFNSKVVDQSKIEDIDIKLIDFGTAYKMSKAKVKCRQLVGTVSYMAPQIIKGFFTDKCDIWSCGVILYILLTSKSPFKCKKKQETLNKILNFQIKTDGATEPMWLQISKQAKDLLLKMLIKDPTKRLSASQALQHPWFLKDQTNEGVKSSGFLKNLSNYYRQNNLISVLQSYLVFAKMTQDERRKMSDIFKQFDQNNDGWIGREQLITAYKKYFPNETLEDIQFILQKIDKDQSGCINFNQFATAMTARQKLFVRNAVQEAFEYFDTDKTGFIEKHQFSKLLVGSDKKQIQQLLNELDIDHDKRISKQQFINYLIKKGCLY